MSSFEQQTGWQQVEPPDTEQEPWSAPYPFSLDDDEAMNWYGPVDLALWLNKGEHLDSNQPRPLFAEVNITESGDTLRFETKPRIIDARELGHYILRVTGKRKLFKEHDDYGDIRFTSTGTSLWIPHLYPFEEVDETGLPLIKDRERCDVTVSLEPLQFTNEAQEATISSPNGEFTAGEAPESYNPWGVLYFSEFNAIGRALVSDLVTYPEMRWLTLAEFFAAELPDLDYYDYFRHPESVDKNLLEPYHRQFEPKNWRVRKLSGYKGNAFGSIWVPLDELRAGTIDASIIFPTLAGSAC